MTQYQRPKLSWQYVEALYILFDILFQVLSVRFYLWDNCICFNSFSRSAEHSELLIESEARSAECYIYTYIHIYVYIDVRTVLDSNNWLIGYVTRELRARAISCLSLETSNMKPFSIIECHLTQYQKFQWENKTKEDYKRSTKRVCKTLGKFYVRGSNIR